MFRARSAITENLSPLNNTLDPQIVREAAAETGIAEAFIEKDWYAVQLLRQLTAFHSDKNLKLVFSGGTSLSKGYHLIKRFSEDLDFIVTTTSELSVGQRRTFRHAVLSHVSSDKRFQIEYNEVTRGDSHRFFKAPIRYAIGFPQVSLRPHLQLEMTFAQNRLPPQQRPVRSIIEELSQTEATFNIACLSPIETAADKLSALTWRVLIRNRTAKNDDPTLIRHLHDLAALQGEIAQNNEIFISCARQSLKLDQAKRGGDIIAQLNPRDRLKQALERLSLDETYKTEYEQFVNSVSYADEDERILFPSALHTLARLIDEVTANI